MLVKPSALTNSRLESEYWQSTPSFGFQLGTRALRLGGGGRGDGGENGASGEGHPKTILR